MKRRLPQPTPRVSVQRKLRYGVEGTMLQQEDKPRPEDNTQEDGGETKSPKVERTWPHLLLPLEARWQ